MGTGGMQTCNLVSCNIDYGNDRKHDCECECACCTADRNTMACCISST